MKGRESIVITKYSNAPELYDELFQEATDRLISVGVFEKDNDKHKIDSLQSYFMHLRDLIYGPEGAEVELAEQVKGYKFLKLPLDEPHLKIDANKRSIDTKSFLDAGGILSVQGDEISEIVFFEIDRYFDATDFAQMQIAIQWKNKEDEGSTPAFIRIVPDTQGKDDEVLIFGWPITSDITRVPGPIQFSVRFYERDDETDNMNYSFVTLPATMNIGASLKTELDEDAMEDPRPVILSRIKNSTILSSPDEVKPPIFVLPSKGNAEPKEVVINGQTEVLQVLARKTGGGGTVNYKWYKSPLDNPLDFSGINPKDNDYWLPAGSDDKNFKKVDSYTDDIATYYYKTKENNEIIYKPMSLEDDAGFNKELASKKELFVKCATLTLDVNQEDLLGYYKVDARVSSAGTFAYASYNGAGNDQSSIYIGNVKDVPYWVVRGPEDVSLNTLPSYGKVGETITLDGAINDTTSFEWHYHGLDEQSDDLVGNEKGYTLSQEGYYSAVAKNYQNGVTKTATTGEGKLIALADIEDFEVIYTLIEGKTYQASLNRPLGFGENVVYEWYNIIDKSQPLNEESTDIYTFEGTVETEPVGQVKAIIHKIGEGIIAPKEATSGLINLFEG